MMPGHKRKGRPLLACAAGIAFVSYVQCTRQPVGNMPDTRDAEPIQPVGNLRAPEPEEDAAVEAAPAAPAPSALPTHHPVGNLRPPPSPREPQ
jgi:hypothetical protein